MPLDAGPMEAGDILAKLDRDGYVVFPDMLPRDDLDRLKARVLSAIAAAGDRTSFIPPSDRPLSSLAPLQRAFALCAEIATKVTGKACTPSGELELVRCLKNDTARHALNFHYDSYALTALFPIILPDAGAPGDLLLVPNARPIRRTYARNLVDKILLDNRFTQARLKRRRQGPGIVRLSLRPGQMVLFTGYRTIHTNDDVDAGQVRATGVIHFGLVHGESPLRRLLRR